MRVLFTTLNGTGHLHPLVPLAQALEQAGHEVESACMPSFRLNVEAIGFPVFAVGFNSAGASTGGFRHHGAALNSLAPRERAAHQAAPETSREHGLRWGIGNIFGGLFAERSLPDLLDVVSTWRPAVLVRESFEFGGYLAAERADLPHAVAQNTTLIDNDWRLDPLRQRLGATRARLGLMPHPGLATLYRFLHLSFSPPSLHDPLVALPPTTHFLRPVPFDRSGGELPPRCLESLPPQPTAYATFGTERVFRPPPLAEVIAGLRDLTLNLIVTVGRHGDPSVFGSQPASVQIERYIPQSLLLPYCDAVVTYGGWNTMIQSLSVGLPMVVIPMGNVQEDQADRLAAVGAGRRISDSDWTPRPIGDAMSNVLDDLSYRAQAQCLRQEWDALPGLGSAVGLLARLTVEKGPLLCR